MSEFSKQNTAAAEQYLAFLAKGQEQLLEQARRLPETPHLSDQSGSTPVGLPTPRELTMAAFSFTEKLIAQQRSFMEQYLDIAERKSADSPAGTGKKG